MSLYSTWRKKKQGFVVTITFLFLGHLEVELVLCAGITHTDMKCTRRHTQKQTRGLALSTKCERKKARCPSEIVIHVAQGCTPKTRVHIHPSWQTERRKNTHSDDPSEETTQRHTARGGKKKVHSGTRTNRWARRRSLSLLLHSLNLSVITTDVSLSWFNFSDAWTKSASFRRRKERKKKKKKRLEGRFLALWLKNDIKQSAAAIWAVEKPEPRESN